MVMTSAREELLDRAHAYRTGTQPCTPLELELLMLEIEQVQMSQDETGRGLVWLECHQNLQSLYWQKAGLGSRSVEN